MLYRKFDGLMGDFTHSCGPETLSAVGDWLAGFRAVLPLREALRPAGEASPAPTERPVAYLRHDVDHSIEHAVKLATWEYERGFKATYFLLHTAWYYEDKHKLELCINRILDMGHEIGLHSNVTVQSVQDIPARARWYSPAGRFSDGAISRIKENLDKELYFLEGMGCVVSGIAAHGDFRTYEMGVYNDLRFTGLKLSDFELDYDADELRIGHQYFSDNHGIWNHVMESPTKSAYVLIHPCHWDLGIS